MQRFAVGIALAVAAIAVPGGATAADDDPGDGGWTSITFDAPVSCSVVCAYWREHPEHEGACGRPFPSGAYDDVLVEVPDWAGGLAFEMYPVGDWDAFVCSTDGLQIANGVNAVGELCDSHLGPDSAIPVGCEERILIRLRGAYGAYEQVIIRAYKWLDVFPAPARYRFW